MINGNNLDQLGERRAAIVLGLTTMELRQLSRLSDLGLEKSADIGQASPLATPGAATGTLFLAISVLDNARDCVVCATWLT